MISYFFFGLVVVGFFMLFKKLRFQQVNNDTDSSIVSLPSPSTCSSRNWKHHVFPSFHGADVRKTFLSHILASFKRKGIYPFIDNNIDRSKSIGPELIEAIRGSKIAIVLLSKNYASSSSWCLDELAEIINCREVLGQIVMPIFYEADPTDIKKQAGDFGIAFRKTCKDETKEHIERWRKALIDVATIAGEHSPNWTNEAAMIEKIATDVLNMLANSTPPRDFDNYVGMRAHMEKMERLLSLDLNEVKMIGIWGPPGIGKSTIARVLFNQFSSRFQHGAIMVNIREFYPRPCLNEYTAQLQLQNQMLSQIIDQKDIKISHLGVAPELLKDKKVLLVIDEVDRLGQLHALAKETEWFGLGSRIIITTEDRSLLNSHQINQIYKVDFPSVEEAFQIFCMHAFGQKQADDDFYGVARKVSDLASELPLGLKVIGSALRGKSKQEWEMILPRLKTSFDGEIESIIKFSYNALCDEDKYLFLYIACFFHSEKYHEVEGLLENQFSNVKQGLYILAEKSLISIDEYGTIEMHTLVKQFGIETSRKQFVNNALAKRHLLVNYRDISNVLTDYTTDSNRFIAINVETSKMIEEELNISDKTLKTVEDLQFIKVHTEYCDLSCEMSRWLQILIFHSQKIRSLTWKHFENICLPSTFNTKFLVKLDLRFSNLQKLWEGNKVLQNLKWMNLTCSEYLEELPDLSTATKLEELILQGCLSLVELPDLSTATKLRKLELLYCSSLMTFSSIGNFNNFKEFDISFCESLVELPFSIGTGTNLQKLYLRGCSSLVKLPSSIGNLINLTEIILWDCSSLVEIPFSIGNLQELQLLKMDGCSKVEAFPTNINLKSLVFLSLNNCSQLKCFPEISTNIRTLTLKGTAISEIPLTIKLWPCLRLLNLNDCNNLVSLPQFPDSLFCLAASNCQSLERLDCSFKNPGIELLFRNCFKLNQEARELIINSSCRYAVLPGTEVPACFKSRATDGVLCTRKLKKLSLPTYLGFKACIMLVEAEGKEEEKSSDGENKSSDSEDERSNDDDDEICDGEDERSNDDDDEISDGEDERSDDNDDDDASIDDLLNVVPIEMIVKQNDHIIPCRSSIDSVSGVLREHIHIFEVAIEVGAKVGTSTELLYFNTYGRKWRVGKWGLMQI